MTRSVAFAVAAAVLAWVPSVALHWIRGVDFATSDFAIVTLAMSSVAEGECVYLRRHRFGPARYVLTILFVWLIGPLALLLGATTTGGGFAQPHTLAQLAKFVLYWPLLTLLGSTYDGYSLGLAALTVTLVVAAFTSARRARNAAVSAN